MTVQRRSFLGGCIAAVAGLFVPKVAGGSVGATKRMPCVGVFNDKGYVVIVSDDLEMVKLYQSAYKRWPCLSWTSITTGSDKIIYSTKYRTSDEQQFDYCPGLEKCRAAGLVCYTIAWGQFGYMENGEPTGFQRSFLEFMKELS